MSQQPTVPGGYHKRPKHVDSGSFHDDPPHVIEAKYQAALKQIKRESRPIDFRWDSTLARITR